MSMSVSTPVYKDGFLCMSSPSFFLSHAASCIIILRIDIVVFSRFPHFPHFPRFPCFPCFLGFPPVSGVTCPVALGLPGTRPSDVCPFWCRSSSGTRFGCKRFARLRLHRQRSFYCCLHHHHRRSLFRVRRLMRILWYHAPAATAVTKPTHNTRNTTRFRLQFHHLFSN